MIDLFINCFIKSLDWFHFTAIVTITLITELLVVGVEAKPDEDVKDHSNTADNIEGHGERMKESKIDAVNANKNESDNKVNRQEDKNGFYIFCDSNVNSIEKKAGENDHSKAKKEIRNGCVVGS